MTGKKVLISFNRAIDQDFKLEDSKLCFLWFEGLIVEDLGKFDKDAFVNGLVDDAVKKRDRHIIHDLTQPVSAILEPECLERRLRSLERGYPRWGHEHENYSYPEPENKYEYAHNELLKFIEQEKGVRSITDEIEIQYAEGRARVAVDAVNLWDRINLKESCVLQATDDENIAVKATKSFGISSDVSSISYQLFASQIPLLANVPWNEIIDLKLSRAFVELKEKISDIASVSNGDPVVAQNVLNKTIAEAMDQIVESHRPKTTAVAIMSALGNIPLPGINPFGIYSSVRDVAKEFKKKDDYTWLYMLRDLKKLDSGS
ncbi:hypothetical protein PMNALOAF_1831 [Methylobacterium adhaesivum]|uniref:Uncharacterized protein n=1 Tax=Methylobacterium adhaesivum TaxID=333297 RepID=A0ABT8BE99_9HYPH|nr:hypothetical protein [Methylobacterium adhaesivum]MDN3589569.1 hypothetical protein [Methylobacterium adhaesivum]GJD30584.1 hypothetical protein PMNALOAF_1831 [Methylobacterium adhaesivum]